MSKQKLFNISLQHIRRQGRPSMHNGACRYRGPEGLSCAAAPFITNYMEKMEFRPFDEIAWQGSVTPEAEEEAMFVTLLQECHDKASYYTKEFMTVYEANMEQLAKDYGLEYQAETV